MVDTSGDEEDGLDEILIPGDYKENGQIVDDWIFDEFVCKVAGGVHVVAMIDCCHSGTAMDLPYVCSVGDGEIRRDDGFKLPITGMELVPKKDKDKKKKKKEKTEKSSSKDKKEKSSSKDKKEQKEKKKKGPKKKVVEPEPDEEEAAEEEAAEEEAAEEEVAEEEPDEEEAEPEPEPEPDAEPEPEPEPEPKKKKKGLFGRKKK
jgi:flagellar biosynthesis GTPase FlhF